MARKYPHFKLWFKGEIVEPERTNVSVFTSAAMRRANIYEGIRSYWNELNAICSSRYSICTFGGIFRTYGSCGWLLPTRQNSTKLL
jgi:hypothetical protein